MEGDIDQITETIYLGNLVGAFNKKKLKNLGIKKNINSYGSIWESL